MAIFWTNQPIAIDIWGSGNAIICTIGRFLVQTRTQTQVIQPLIVILFSNMDFDYSRLRFSEWSEGWCQTLAPVDLGKKSTFGKF